MGSGDLHGIKENGPDMTGVRAGTAAVAACVVGLVLNNVTFVDHHAYTRAVPIAGLSFLAGTAASAVAWRRLGLAGRIGISALGVVMIAELADVARRLLALFG